MEIFINQMTWWEIGEMKNRRFVSIFFKCYYYRGLYTGDGFKIRVDGSKYNLIFRIYWGPYKDSRHLWVFIGIDPTVLLDRRVDKLIRNPSLEKRLAMLKTLSEIKT